MSFSHQRWLMVFLWSLSDWNFLQVSRTLLSILADLNNAVVLMVSTRPRISKSSSPFTKPLVTVPRAPVIIGITVTFMFHNFFSSLARSKYLFFFFHFLLILVCSRPGEQSLQFCKFSFFIDYYMVWSSDQVLLLLLLLLLLFKL